MLQEMLKVLEYFLDLADLQNHTVFEIHSKSIIEASLYFFLLCWLLGVILLIFKMIFKHCEVVKCSVLCFQAIDN